MKKLKLNIKSDSTPVGAIEVTDTFMAKAVTESRWQPGETKLGHSYKAKPRKAHRYKTLDLVKYRVDGIEGEPRLEIFNPNEYMSWRDDSC